MKMVITVRILLLLALAGVIAFFIHRRGRYAPPKRASVVAVAPATAATTNPAKGLGMQDRIPDSEYTALVDIFYLNSGTAWRNHSGWLDPQASTWYGVGVSGGHVTELDLSTNHVAGPLPPSLGDLPQLRRIALSGNLLTGRIPPGLGDLSFLEEIHIEGNLIGGRIPDTLTNLLALKRLNASENQLSGPIPSTLGALTALEEIDVSRNRLNWVIPESMTNLARLRDFRASANYLSGAIPESLGELRALTNLSLANNQLTGDAPVLAGLRKATIDISTNHLNILKGSASWANIQAWISAGNQVKFEPQTVASDASPPLKPAKKSSHPSHPPVKQEQRP